MKTYNKEKLNEYAKELFALCLDKGLKFNDFIKEAENATVYFDGYFINTYTNEYNYKCNSVDKGNLILPIWELIEKVKAL